MFVLLLAIIYIAFISLGLPDSLLGSAWPLMSMDFNVPVSYASIISIVISLGTIISSLFSEKLNKKIGTALVVSISTLMTALSLLGFAWSSDFWLLLVFSVPLGLGAGAIDAALNNYVALHYKSSHMSWLHCMWGVGASIGPYIMGFSMVNYESWNGGYLIIAIIQIVLSVFLFISIPLWKKQKINPDIQVEDTKEDTPLSFKEILKIKGIHLIMIAFFCYCAVESLLFLWSSTYYIEKHNIHEDLAASLASAFYIGMTISRLISGFLSIKLSDKFMIVLGCIIVLIGGTLLILDINEYVSFASIIIIGLGCGPIYPCIIHSTPYLFGKDKSQAVIGFQISSAYFAFLIVPILFGILVQYISSLLLPLFVLVFILIVLILYLRLHTIKMKQK